MCSIKKKKRPPLDMQMSFLFKKLICKYFDRSSGVRGETSTGWWPLANAWEMTKATGWCPKRPVPPAGGLLFQSAVLRT